MNSPTLLAFVVLLLAAGIVYWSCEYFVNGVEWVGRMAGVSQNSVGTVLAAFGTALPESVVTFVAVVMGQNAAARNIGVGAALGGPLVLATVAYPVVGLMLLLTRSPPGPIDLDSQRLSRDQGWFLLIFCCKITLGFMAFAIKPFCGWLFLLAYAAYTWTEMRHTSDGSEEEPEALLFQPKRANPSIAMAGLQTLLALVVIFGASRVFVGELSVVGPWHRIARDHECRHLDSPGQTSPRARQHQRCDDDSSHHSNGIGLVFHAMAFRRGAGARRRHHRIGRDRPLRAPQTQCADRAEARAVRGVLRTIRPRHRVPLAGRRAVAGGQAALARPERPRAQPFQVRYVPVSRCTKSDLR